MTIFREEDEELLGKALLSAGSSSAFSDLLMSETIFEYGGPISTTMGQLSETRLPLWFQRSEPQLQPKVEYPRLGALTYIKES